MSEVIVVGPTRVSVQLDGRVLLGLRRRCSRVTTRAAGTTLLGRVWLRDVAVEGGAAR